ncbi:tetratricopeptide repeat-containing sensor histidine kinase [Spongiimicrobium salis]|uniref:tetratricopeptide repeat-containing sensor histidine kinase n=1 Tax=Spongiimicrobium salis TaxID=1667022 RepID=UPI00374DD4B1
MRHFIFLLILVCFYCCTDTSFQKQSTGVPFSSEEVQQLYERAITDSVSLKERKIAINRALRLHTETDSLKSILLYSKCNIHLSLQEYDSLFHFGEVLKHSTKQGNNFLAEGRYYHLLAYYHRTNAFNLDSSFYYNNQAKNQFIKVGDSGRAGRRLLSMGVIQKVRNDYFGAKETLTEALQYLNPNQDQKFIASVYNELGTNNNKLLNFEDAIGYYQKAIRESTSHRDILIYTNNLATVYIDIEAYPKAIALLEEIEVDSTLRNLTIPYARVLDNMSYAQWKSGEEKNSTNLIRALDLRKIGNDQRGQLASYTHLGEFYANSAPIRAKRYLDTVIQISKQLKIPKAEKDALGFLMEMMPKNTDYKERYIFLQDSMYQKELQVKTQFAKMKYDDRIKQEAILSLEADQALKDAALAKQRIQKITYLASSGFLLLMGIFLFVYMRQRHKRERVEQIYATEKRISKKVHDELANDIYGVMTNLQHSTRLKNEELLDTLESIYDKTRDISHETGDVQTRNFHLEMKKLLAQYQSDLTTVAVKGLDENLWKNIVAYKKIAIYRVINELMVNMKKHSGANVVSLHFERKSQRMNIHYIDNGKGMPIGLKKKNGLVNVENRIHSIDGKFIFDTEFKKGVKFNIIFPI